MKYSCGICGRERKADRMIYSRFSGRRYCKEHLFNVPKRKRKVAA